MALRFAARPPPFLRAAPRCRYYSAPSSVKVPVELIKELRTHNPVTLTKAREALSASNLSVPAALQWLEEDAARSGAAKAAKVANRVAAEGVAALSILGPQSEAASWGAHGVRAAIVELNCETDFVSRSGAFNKLAADIAHTVAFVAEPELSLTRSESSKLFREFSIDQLGEAPLMQTQLPASGSAPANIRSAVQEAISKFGEKISLRRAATIVAKPSLREASTLWYRLGAYAHGGQTFELGQTAKVASLVAFKIRTSKLGDLAKDEEFVKEVGRLTQSLARQATGMETTQLWPESAITESNPTSTALYAQPFIMLAGQPTDEAVELVIKKMAEKWGIKEEGDLFEAVDLVRWKVGEGMEKKEDDFAEEVRKLAGQ